MIIAGVVGLLGVTSPNEGFDAIGGERNWDAIGGDRPGTNDGDEQDM